MWPEVYNAQAVSDKQLAAAQPLHDRRRPKTRQDIDCKDTLQGSACGLLVCPCRGRFSSTRRAGLFEKATTSKVYSTLTALLKAQQQGAGQDDLGCEHAGAMLSSLRRVSLLTDATAQKVASTLTQKSQHLSHMGFL